MTSSVFVADAILAHAASAPERRALVCQGESVTYRGLVQRAALWAEAIREVRSLDEPTVDRAVVGVLRRRDAEVPITHLAAWLTGAGYLPLDPDLPAGRLAAILEDAGCRIVLTTRELADLVPSGITCVTEPAGAAGGSEPLPTSDSLAYVIYTSGSTGRPKGVEINHGSLANLTTWYAGYFNIAPGTQTGMLANLAFDGLVLDVWCSLAAGATVRIPSQETLGDVERVFRFLGDTGVGHTYLPTPVAEVAFELTPPATFRSIATGGDRLRVWPREAYPAAVFNMYGPTETTVLVTASPDLRYLRREGLPPIGQPVAGALLHLLSEGSVDDRVGVEGELAIGGPVVGNGYRRRDLGRGVFVEKPDLGPGYWYLTGDLCRWRPDGQLDFIGRSDQQIKIRGYRVELGEVEQSLFECTRAEQIVVTQVGRQHPTGLVAWVVGGFDEQGAIRCLRDRLPDYMVPSRIVALEAMPLTPNGKIDRAALERRGDEAAG